MTADDSELSLAAQDALPPEDLATVLRALGEGDEQRAALLQALQDAVADTGNEMPAITQQLIDFAAHTPYFDLADYMGRTWVRPVEPGQPYAARLHNIRRSDIDRALHDHPWANASLVLSGGYWEVLPGTFQRGLEFHLDGRVAGERQFDSAREAEDAAAQARFYAPLIQAQAGDDVPAAELDRLRELGVLWRAPRTYTPRLATSLHRLVVPTGRQAWSLFVMRPKIRDWGFLTPDGWVHNVEYLRLLGREA